jgi:hypothetical protein
MRMWSRRCRLAIAAFALVPFLLRPAPHELMVEARGILSSPQHAVAAQRVNVTGTIIASNNSQLDHRGSDGTGDVYDYNVTGRVVFTATGATGSIDFHSTFTRYGFSRSAGNCTITSTDTATQPFTYSSPLSISPVDAETNPSTGETFKSDATHIVYTTGHIFPGSVDHANQTGTNTCGAAPGRTNFGEASFIGDSTYVLGSAAPGSTGLKGQMNVPLTGCQAGSKCSGGEKMSWDLHRINLLDIHQVHLMNRDAHPDKSSPKEYTPLKFLSASPHPYCGNAGSSFCLGVSGASAGFTKVFGTVDVVGESQQYLASLILRVKENGNTIAESKPFEAYPMPHAFGRAILGKIGRIRIAKPTLLFDLPSADFATVMQNHDGNLELEIEATSDWGDKATKSLGTVEKLVWAEGLPRYGTRDPDYGGDGWVKPSVLDVVRYYTNHHPAAMHGLAWGDFSRMNGGHFHLHGSHRIGNDVDGFFSGYWECEFEGKLTNDQNCEYGIPVPTLHAVDLLIQWLNEDVTYERRIQYCFVDYQIPLVPGKGRAIDQTRNAIYHLLETTRLKDGRLAFHVIRQDPEHYTHFHLRITPKG